MVHLQLIPASQDSGSRQALDDVDSGPSHERPPALRPDDLAEAVQGARVLDSLARRHHHPALDGVEGITEQAGGEADHPA